MDRRPNGRRRTIPLPKRLLTFDWQERRAEAARYAMFSPVLRDHGFVRNEGLAYEVVAARFYTARGFETIATAYIRNAKYCYLRWRASPCHL
jgi:hypothetical protein